MQHPPNDVGRRIGKKEISKYGEMNEYTNFKLALVGSIQK